MKSMYADLLLLLTAVIWGTGFVASQFALDSGMSTSFILLIRFSVAALVMLGVLHRKLATLTGKEIGSGIITGSLLFLAFFSQTYGLQFTTPSNNAFITATNVIMVPFITWMFFRKRPHGKFFVLPFVTFVGVAFLTYSPEHGLHFSKGDAFTLLCAFFFALHISYLDIVSKRMDVSKLTFLQMATAAILSGVYLLVIDNGRMGNSIDWSLGLPWSLYLGIFSTMVAFFIQTYAQKFTSSTKTAIFLSTESLFGALFSVLLALEPFSPFMVVGGAIILLSIILSELKIPFHAKGMAQFTKNTG